jgi:hypothetical protein
LSVESDIRRGRASGPAVDERLQAVEQETQAELEHRLAPIRDLFGNPAPHGGGWIEEHALPMAMVRPVLITAIFLPLAVRRFQALGR